MKANELRIGNFVTIDNPKHHPSIKGKPLIVLAIDEIDEPKCSLICTDPKENLIIPAYSQFLKFIQPIPLTAEWLEKLGALKDEYGDVFIEVDSDSDMRLYLSTKHYIQLVQSHHCPMFNYEHIKCVHQLQNLFFALTGEELTIKEDKK